MPNPTVAPRPAEASARIPVPTDDGLFGPDTVTWRLGTAPAAAVAIPAAVLMQMLHPRVMWMIDQASTFWQYPERRAQLTQRYGMSTTYGDTATAEHAGTTLRTIHSRLTATDPLSGEEYRADEADLLMWVYCTIPYAILRALDRWGPALTPADQDRYVLEQRTAARLVGIDPDTAPGSVADLDAYMTSMQPKMALTPGSVRLLALLAPRAPKPTAAALLQSVFSHAALSLLTAQQRRMYGVRWTWLDERSAAVIPGILLRKAAATLNTDEQLDELRTEAMTHPFGGRPRPPVVASGAGPETAAAPADALPTAPTTELT
ncbi:MAG: oxygenase MpaB family protein [Ilumatobacteraceae bacterium]